jgi:hypothetical protein
VPLGRYFAFVGGVLVGMLFFANWYLPSASSQTFFREARVDKSIIRIKSAHKWPEPIVIDASLPTIVPPPPVLAKAPIINQPREALALRCREPQSVRGRRERSAKSLHMQNCSAALVSSAEPNKGSHWDNPIQDF